MRRPRATTRAGRALPRCDAVDRRVRSVQPLMLNTPVHPTASTGESRAANADATRDRRRRSRDSSKADAKRALVALDQIVLDELGNAQKVRIGGLVQPTGTRRSRRRRRARAAIPRPARRSRSPPSPPRSICGPAPSRGPRRPCRRCRKRAAGSPPDWRSMPPLSTRAGTSRHSSRSERQIVGARRTRLPSEAETPTGDVGRRRRLRARAVLLLPALGGLGRQRAGRPRTAPGGP